MGESRVTHLAHLLRARSIFLLWNNDYAFRELRLDAFLGKPMLLDSQSFDVDIIRADRGRESEGLTVVVSDSQLEHSKRT